VFAIMMLSKRNTAIMALLPVAAVVIGLAGFMYYQKVYAPAHEHEWIYPLNSSTRNRQ
jgi:hypothetical protein